MSTSLSTLILDVLESPFLSVFYRGDDAGLQGFKLWLPIKKM